jgi:plastocyanin
MRALSLILLLTAIAIPVAGCGGDDDDGGGGGGGGGGADTAAGTTETQTEDTGGGASGGAAQTLKISADPGGALKFDKTSLSAKAGKVTIEMDNPSDLPHAVEIEGNGVEVAGDTVMKDGVSKATADLKPGEYDFYCPVGNHRDAGMEGTLTVN